MSQFQTSGPNPQYGTRRGPVTQVPRTGITGSLVSPGLAAMPIDDRGAVMARQILNVIGGVGETAGMVGRMQEARNREQMQIAREQQMEEQSFAREQKAEERQAQMEQRAIEAADKGTGAQMANNNELRFVDQIRKGEVVFDKPEDAVAAWRSRGEELQLNPSQMAGWMAGSQRFIAESYDFNNRKTAEAQVSLAENYKAAVISGELAPEQAKVLAGFTFTKQGVVDQNAVDRFFLDVAKDASINGNEKLLNDASSQLSDQNRYVPELDKAKEEIKRFRNNQENAINISGWDIFYTGLNNNIPTSQMLDLVNDLEKKGVNQQNIFRMKDAIADKQRINQNELIKMRVEAAKVDFFNKTIERNFADTATNSGYNIKDEEIVLEDGTTFKVTKTEIEKSLVQRKQQELISQYPASPDQQLLGLVDWSGNNGISLEDVKNRFKAGAASINADTETLPPIAAEAYRTFKLIQNNNPNYIDRLDIGNQSALNLYETASILEENGIARNSLEALKMATQYRDPKSILRTTKEESEKIQRLVEAEIGLPKNSGVIAGVTLKSLPVVFTATGGNVEQAANILARKTRNMVGKANDLYTPLDDTISRVSYDNWQGITDILANEWISSRGLEKDAKRDSFYLVKSFGNNYVLADSVTGTRVGASLTSQQINEIGKRASLNKTKMMVEIGRMRREMGDVPPGGGMTAE
jgi:hypothetical protein